MSGKWQVPPIWLQSRGVISKSPILFALRLTQTASRIVPFVAFGMRGPNELEVMRLKCKKRAIYVKNLSKQRRE